MPAASTSSSPVLVSKHHSPLKEPESSLKKRLVTDLGQRWMMSPGSPLLPESKETISEDDRGTGGREKTQSGRKRGSFGRESGTVW